MALRDWSTIPGSNANVGSINWAEGQAPSTINDSARQMMADVADWTKNGPEWYPRDSATYASATTFTVPGDQTLAYTAGRRVWAMVMAGNVYGSVVSATFGTTTTVTILPDSGSLDSGLSSVRIGPQTTNTSFPTGTNANFNVLTAASLSVSGGATLATLAATTATIIIANVGSLSVSGGAVVSTLGAGIANIGSLSVSGGAVVSTLGAGIANIGSLSVSAALKVSGLSTLTGLHLDGVISLSASQALGLTMTTNTASVGIVMSCTGGRKYLYVNNFSQLYVQNSAASATIMALDDAGNLSTLGTVNGASDENLKEDWASLPDDFVDQLANIRRCGTFSRIDTGERSVGVGAQSLMDILPEAVYHGGAHLSVAYGQAALVACVMLCRRVLALEAQIDELKKT